MGKHIDYQVKHTDEEGAKKPETLEDVLESVGNINFSQPSTY